jgi:hypothetical protein
MTGYFELILAVDSKPLVFVLSLLTVRAQKPWRLVMQSFGADDYLPLGDLQIRRARFGFHHRIRNRVRGADVGECRT